MYAILDPVSVAFDGGAPADASAFAVAGRIAVDAVQFRLGDAVAAGANAALSVRVNGQDSNQVLLPVQ